MNAQHTDRFTVENDKMNSYTEAESELSSESRSFLHKVNDQVRKRQNESSKDATKDSDKHSVIWRMFMSSTLQASVFMVKNFSDIWHSIKNTEDLTMKQVIDISEKMITEQSDEFYGIITINCEHPSWKYLSLVGDEQVISLLHTSLRILRVCIVLWKDESEPTVEHCMGSKHPVFRSTSPLSRGVLKSKFGADFETIETVFRTVVSVNQLSLYGAVAEMCEECDSCHDRTGRPV